MRVAKRAVLTGIAASIVIIGTAANARDAAVDRGEGARIVQVAPVAAPARNLRAGKFRINGSLRVNASLPAGTVLTISVSASTSAAPYENYASLQGTAKVAAGKATFSLLLPYSWQVASASTPVAVSVFVNGSAYSGATSRSNFSSFSKSLTLPANGVTTVLGFAGSI